MFCQYVALNGIEVKQIMDVSCSLFRSAFIWSLEGNIVNYLVFSMCFYFNCLNVVELCNSLILS